MLKTYVRPSNSPLLSSHRGRKDVPANPTAARGASPARAELTVRSNITPTAPGESTRFPERQTALREFTIGWLQDLGKPARPREIAAQSNRTETLSSLAMRAIASPISGAIEMTRILCATLTASVGAIVSVSTSSLS